MKYNQPLWPFVVTMAFWIIVVAALFLSGCTTRPLSVLPQIGDKYGADEIKCSYERKDKKYTLDCTIHDEGETE